MPAVRSPSMVVPAGYKNLCWAVVSAAVADCYEKVPRVSACALATKYVGGGDACAGHNPACDRDFAIEPVLEGLGVLATKPEVRVSDARLLDALKRGCPPVLWIYWRGLGATVGHYVLLVEFDGTDCTVLDPGLPTPHQKRVPIAALREGTYRDTGKWEMTIFTRSPSKKKK